MKLADKSIFAMFEKRLELLYKLKDNGFYVRMHAYEYIVGTGDRIVTIILLEPNRNVVEVLRLERASDRDIERVITTIKSLDPNVRVNIKFFGSEIELP